MAEPRATYRIQLRPGFGFDAAAGIADYLARLGVSHVYVSPYLQAAAGSTHGYDVVDHGRVNEELGGAAAHERFCGALGEAGLGQVLDIVPNHMAITAGNRWWWDVLEDGPASVYAAYFDVDWDPPEAKLRNTVLLPVLGDHYGRALDAGEIRVERRTAAFTVTYFDHSFPVAPRSLWAVLGRAAELCGSDDLAFLADAHGELPVSTATDLASVTRRHRDKEVLRRLLGRLFEEDRGIGLAVDAALGELNADPAALGSFLDAQNYRLAHWRTAGRELDYRRFFDISTLVGLRVEDERVFRDTHGLVIDWAAAGVLDGLRVDHPDGLRDPERYMHRLAHAAPDAWIVVEKILEAGEELRQSWPVAGTTGYEFLNDVLGLFVDPTAEAAMTALYREITGEETDWHRVAYDRKHQVMRETLAADVTRLTELLSRVCEGRPRYRDYTRHELHEAVREVIACFPVYRTYVRPGEPPSAADRRYLGAAVRAATERRPELDADLLTFLRSLLEGGGDGPLEEELVLRFQQLTGPVTAKGVEDTAFYAYGRLVALNEVGGDPSRFGVTPDEHHAAMEARQRDWPRAMLTTSTHDTKRSEDVRARLAVLSEMAQEWAAAVRRWSARADRHRRDGLPDRNAEYLLYQTLVGAWPIEPERVAAYMEKAVHEAKTHTSWIDPAPAYEAALAAFVEGVLADDELVSDLDEFVAGIVAPGRTVALAQTLLKLTAPGVPDTYQGCELWDLSLVDPDNRRPVDWDERRRLLDALDGATAEDVVKRADEGLPKLHLTRQALALRARRPEAFAAGTTYQRVVPSGTAAGHVVAHLRGGVVAAVVPRLVVRLGGRWGDTAVHLPDGRWHNVLTGDDVGGGDVKVSGLLDRFPVALLEREDA